MPGYRAFTRWKENNQPMTGWGFSLNHRPRYIWRKPKSYVRAYREKLNYAGKQIWRPPRLSYKVGRGPNAAGRERLRRAHRRAKARYLSMRFKRDQYPRFSEWHTYYAGLAHKAYTRMSDLALNLAPRALKVKG